MNADYYLKDAKLHTPLTDLVRGYKYTVIYTSTPPSSLIQPSTSSSVELPLYEPEFQNLEHMDLKRNLKIREDNISSNATDMLPLFEKYQFLTPGTYLIYPSLPSFPSSLILLLGETVLGRKGSG